MSPIRRYAKRVRAFLRKENVPEEETETLVSKVKEKKMGELFANMDKMDIQEERRKTAEAVKRAEEAEKRVEEAEKKAEEAEKKAEEAEKKVEEAEKKAEEVQKRAEQIIDEAYDIGIKGMIKSCKRLNASKEFIVTQVQEMCACNREEAEKLVERYWND